MYVYVYVEYVLTGMVTAPACITIAFAAVAHYHPTA
jgi:hypothetical protein